MNKLWKRKGIEKRIGGEEGDAVVFYPLSVGMLFRVKNTCKELAPFLAMCFTDTSKDNDRETISGVKQEGDGVYPVTDVIEKAVAPSIVSQRHQQKEKGIESLLETIFAPDTRDLLADMIIASASDQFTEDSKKELLDECPVPVFIELLAGVFESSAGAFASLGEFLPRLIKNKDVLAGGAEKLRSMGRNPEQ